MPNIDLGKKLDKSRRVTSFSSQTSNKVFSQYAEGSAKVYRFGTYVKSVRHLIIDLIWSIHCMSQIDRLRNTCIKAEKYKDIVNLRTSVFFYATVSI